MNLFEISEDDFKTPKATPQEELTYLAKKQKNLDYQIVHTRAQLDHVITKVIGKFIAATWQDRDPTVPEQKLEFDKKVAHGMMPVWSMLPGHYLNDTLEHKKYVKYFIANIPENQVIAKRLEKLLHRSFQLDKMRDAIPGQIKRAKGRLSAWKRKQPTYVGRATGKELLQQLRDKVTEFMTTKNWPLSINNAYYWAKNKMIVIEIPVRNAMEGKSQIDAAKTVVKPQLVEFLTSLGYTQFRVTDRYFVDSRSTIVKIQLDDVEAKEKAGESNEAV